MPGSSHSASAGAVGHAPRRTPSDAARIPGMDAGRLPAERPGRRVGSARPHRNRRGRGRHPVDDRVARCRRHRRRPADTPVPDTDRRVRRRSRRIHDLHPGRVSRRGHADPRGWPSRSGHDECRGPPARGGRSAAVRRGGDRPSEPSFRTPWSAGASCSSHARKAHGSAWSTIDTSWLARRPRCPTRRSSGCYSRSSPTGYPCAWPHPARCGTCASLPARHRPSS